MKVKDSYVRGKAVFAIGDRVLYNSGRMCRTSEPFTSGELVATGTIIGMRCWFVGTPRQRISYKVRYDKPLFPKSWIAPTRELNCNKASLKKTDLHGVRKWINIIAGESP